MARRGLGGYLWPPRRYGQEDVALRAPLGDGSYESLMPLEYFCELMGLVYEQPRSVNAGVPFEWRTRQQYSNFDTMRYVIIKKWFARPGTAILIAKRDILHAFRNLMARSEDTPLTIFFDEGTGSFWLDLRANFGSRPYPAYMERSMHMLCWLLANPLPGGANAVDFTAIIDDLGVVSYHDEAAADLEVVDGLMRALGMPPQEKKMESEGTPSTTQEWVGVEFNLEGLDIHDWFLTLSEERRLQIIAEIDEWLAYDQASPSKLEHLFGVLNWASAVTAGGKTWLFFVLERLRAAKAKHGSVRLTVRFFEDLRWWRDHLLAMGSAGLRLSRPLLNRVRVVLKSTTDACTSLIGGGGGWLPLGGSYHCFTVAWTPAERALIPAEYGTADWAALHATEGSKPLWIQRLEFYIMCVGVVVFAPLLRGMDVALDLVGDNLGSVQILTRERSRKDPVIAIMHRWLSLFAAKHGIELGGATFLAGSDNQIADALSREEWEEFARLTSDAPKIFHQVASDSSIRRLLLDALRLAGVPL